MGIFNIIQYITNIIYYFDYDKYKHNKVMSRINERINRDKNGEFY